MPTVGWPVIVEIGYELVIFHVSKEAKLKSEWNFRVIFSSKAVFFIRATYNYALFAGLGI